MLSLVLSFVRVSFPVVLLRLIGKILFRYASISLRLLKIRGLLKFRACILIFFGIGGLFIEAHSGQAQATDIGLYNYHQSPPFVIGPKEGLSYDLAAYLNRRGQGLYSFSLTHLPRKRLDRFLKADRRGVVLWATPNWFGDAKRNRYSWTRPIMQDGNVFISPSNRPVDVKKNYNLNNLLIGGILGYRYKDVDVQVAQGLAKRTDVMGERALLRLVAQGRVDVGILSQSAAKYLVREIGLEEQIYFGRQKHSVYARRLLIKGVLPRLKKFLDKTIAQMERDPEWIAILERYNLSPTVTCLSPQISSRIIRQLNREGGEEENIQAQDCQGVDDQDRYLMGENAFKMKNSS